MNKQIIDISDQIKISAQEAFRFLSTNLILDNKNRDLKAISISSFKPREGKTTIAINLAVALTKTGLKILLIDADIRKTRELKPHNDVLIGLTNYHQGNEIDEYIFDTNVKNLKYVMSGTHTVDSIELLSGKHFDSFLNNTRTQFDMIVIDTPSTGLYADGIIIASKSSGTLIVANSSKTSYTNIERIKWQMNNVEANVIGLVLNQVPRSDYKSFSISK